MAGLPPEVIELAERSPVEDFLLDLYAQKLPSVKTSTLIADDQTFPFLLVRRIPGLGENRGDPRFVDSAAVSIQAFVEDPNGDEDAAILSEAARVVLRDAWLKNYVVPGRGHITTFEMSSAPRRVTDWATASGPVQYADLPSGVWRYEAQFYLTIRRPISRLA